MLVLDRFFVRQLAVPSAVESRLSCRAVDTPLFDVFLGAFEN